MKLTDFVSLTPIDYGWSGDRKYRAVTPDGTPTSSVSPPVSGETAL